VSGWARGPRAGGELIRSLNSRPRFNGELKLEVEDSALQDAGKVGLWTKADAVASFDNLSVTVPSD